MKVLVTGAGGFIGKNLVSQFSTRPGIEVVSIEHEPAVDGLRQAITTADFICHFAGVNRPTDPADFQRVNVGLTRMICEAVAATGRRIPIVFASSIQAERENPYGVSKRDAEGLLIEHARQSGAPVHILRLPNVFGKWCKPNYNSAVATFCHNLARDLPIQINDAAAPLKLVYVDVVVETIAAIADGRMSDKPFTDVAPVYETTVGEVAELIRTFRTSRSTLVTERVGTGLVRALYATYLSYLPKEQFRYPLTKHADPRGLFAEVLKTKDSGQFSFFTAGVGVTRGGHYHHTKNEKFLVVKGRALFRFREILTGEYHEIATSAADAEVVEIVPGWSHDITNTGDDELIVMLWANEIFDRDRSDTYPSPL